MQAGNYVFGERIGVGGAGAVYQAVDLDGRQVAIKVVPRSTSQRDARIGRELGSQAILGDALGFVPLLDTWSDERFSYLVMPLLTGGSLADRLRFGPLPPIEADGLAVRLAWSLAQAHERGIVHRDVKPANILFDADGRAFIADLGLAKQFEEAGGLSRTGELRGSVGYLAPEQINDAKHVGPPADVFSWGVVVFEAMTGRQAFPGERPLDRLNQVVLANVPPLRDHCPEAAPLLEEAVAWALRPLPGDRPADAGVLLQHLSAAPADVPHQRSRWPVLLAALALAAALLAIWASRAGAPAGVEAPPMLTPPRTESTPTPRATPAPPTPSEKLDPETDRLRRGWPATAPLRPEAVVGSQSGNLGEPILALGWKASGHLIAVGQTRARTWDPQRGVIGTRALDLPPSIRRGLVLDATRNRLWVAGSTTLEVWDLSRGRRLGKVRARARSAPVALAPNGLAVAFATRRDLLVWAGGPRLKWKRRHGQPKGGKVAMLDADRVVVAGQDLRILGQSGDPERLPLAAPVGTLGALIVLGEAIFGLDDGGHLLRWDTAPLRQTYRRLVLAPPATTSKRRRKRKNERRWLTAVDGRLWLGHVGGAPSTGKLLAFDPATGARQEEHALEGIAGVAPQRAGRWATAHNKGASGRVSVWNQSGRSWPGDALSASGPLAVATEGAALTPGPPAVRWTRRGGTRLPGERASREAFRPLPDALGYVCLSPSLDLHLWRNDGLAPARIWKRRTPAVPLGASALDPLVALSGQRAVGFSLQTLGVRKGNTVTIRGQRKVLTVFGPTGQRALAWKGPAPIALAPDTDPEQVRVVTEDRHGLVSLRDGEWKRPSTLPAPAAKYAVFSPGGGSFARWPAGDQGHQIEVWPWGAAEPRLKLTGRTTRGRLGKGSFALTDRVAVWCAGGRLTVWDLTAPGRSYAPPLGSLRAQEVQAARTGEVWVNTSSGALILLAPPR